MTSKTPQETKEERSFDLPELNKYFYPKKKEENIEWIDSPDW